MVPASLGVFKVGFLEQKAPPASQNSGLRNFLELSAAGPPVRSKRRAWAKVHLPGYRVTPAG